MYNVIVHLRATRLFGVKGTPAPSCNMLVVYLFYGFITDLLPFLLPNTKEQRKVQELFPGNSCQLYFSIPDAEMIA